MSESGQQGSPPQHGAFSSAAMALGLAELPGVRHRLRGAPPPAERKRVALLARALETEVIPRLVLAHHEARQSTAIVQPGAVGPTAEDMAALTAIVMRGDIQAGLALMAGLRARHVPLECLYLDLLAPVARHLGDLWIEDRCDFTAVTVGLCCLQQLVLEHGHALSPRAGRRAGAPRVLLAPVPGEQHSFGLLIVGEFFRRQGWDVSSGTGASARELVALTRKQHFDVIGLSVACESRLDALATVIRDIRRATRNPRLGVLVGGQCFLERPELAALVGADATASDGNQAVLKAETLLALLVQAE